MNTSGGLILLYSNSPASDKKRDYWIMGLEYVLTNNWIPESLLQSLLRYRYLETDGQLRIYIFVSQSPSLVTFNFYAFGRRATGVRPIKDPGRIQKMLKESHRIVSAQGCLSQMYQPKEGDSFKVNDPIPVAYRESDTMEFKHCYDQGKSELPCFDATRLKDRLGDHFAYLSAFANTQGGSLVIGVEESEKYPVVRGFPVTQNQKADETCITEYLKKRLEKCIWHGDPENKPVRGRDWNVFYHKVVENNGGERKMIEVVIAKHSGGMFLQPPLHYVVNGNGDIEVKRVYHEWKSQLQTDTLDADKKGEQSHLQKHVERASTELNDQDVPNTIASNAPQDQSQLDTTPTAVESKLPKSFRESQSEHKSDIMVQGLSMHDCCTNKMMKHIQTHTGDNIWFPSTEHALRRLPRTACSEKLMKFLHSKRWHGVASIIHVAKESNTTNRFDLPTSGCYSLICHVLIIRKNEPPMIMCCIHDTSHCEITKKDLNIIAGYALDSGRSLKKKFMMSTANKQHQSDLFHFDVTVLLVPTEGNIRTVWDSTKKQPVTYPNAHKDTHYTIACTGLAEELLRTRSSVKDRYGQVLMEHLTEAQAKVLFAKPERVLLVNGKSGTGKTVIALHLMMEAIKENVTEDVIYVCSTEGLKTFVISQVSCQVIVLKRTNLLTQYEKKMLGKAKLIIVDDAHAIELDKHWETNNGDLYLTLFNHTVRPKVRVAVFVDEEQDYKKNLPIDFDIRLRNLAEKIPGMLSEDIKIVNLKERIRNSQEVSRFMQANQNQANISARIECLNESPGDDVIYEYLGSSPEECGKILNARLDALEKKYDARSVAILCDDTDQLSVMKALLKKNFNKRFQEDDPYPIQHMVMCSLEEFGGLEAEVILFLLPQNFGTGEVQVSWKYVNVISSRARERVEFLLPWDPVSDQSGDEEKHGKLTDLLELFKMVSQIRI